MKATDRFWKRVCNALRKALARLNVDKSQMIIELPIKPGGNLFVLKKSSKPIVYFCHDWMRTEATRIPENLVLKRICP
uniref:Uncharacterized protein n=1 Tax=mine drainage metagenome TaxID=410659 RepID=E6QUH8_9ZZZZ